MPKISVIVPVYNTSSYLKQCFDSILKQTMRDIEVIIIDDGSTDGSGVICDNYALQDERIRVIHNQNKGLAETRNIGIDAARSDYIMFVDSDDWVEPDFCRRPYELMLQHSADLVMFNQTCHYKEKVKDISMTPLREGKVDKREVMPVLKRSLYNAVWNKLFERKLFNYIRFPSGRIFEDVGTTYKIVKNANNIVYTNEKLYNYRIDREGSLSSTKTNKSLIDYFDLWHGMNEDLSRWGYECVDFEEESFCYLITMGKGWERSEEAEEIVRKIKFIPDSFSRKHKLMFVVYKLSPALFDVICVKTGHRLILK